MSQPLLPIGMKTPKSTRSSLSCGGQGTGRGSARSAGTTSRARRSSEVARRLDRHAGPVGAEHEVVDAELVAPREECRGAVLRRPHHETIAGEVVVTDPERLRPGHDTVLAPVGVDLVLPRQVRHGLLEGLLARGGAEHLPDQRELADRAAPGGLPLGPEQLQLPGDGGPGGVRIDHPGVGETGRPPHRAVGVGRHPDRRVAGLRRGTQRRAHAVETRPGQVGRHGLAAPERLDDPEVLGEPPDLLVGRDAEGVVLDLPVAEPDPEHRPAAARRRRGPRRPRRCRRGCAGRAGGSRCRRSCRPPRRPAARATAAAGCAPSTRRGGAGRRRPSPSPRRGRCAPGSAARRGRRGDRGPAAAGG